MRRITIAGRAVGAGAPCFVIAEAGVNHNGDLDLALRLVDAAAAAGADAVKFQIIHAEAMVTRETALALYQAKNMGGAIRTQYDMLRKLELSGDAYVVLRERCERLGLIFLATPFDCAGADFLAGLDVPAFKIGSGEITNPDFLAHVAALGRPVILSTGMATMEEVASALETVRRAGSGEIVLLHCVSSYPAEPEDINLHAMRTMRLVFGVPVGFSDHTRGVEIAPAAVALGACVIEKHFTLDRSLPGPDHAASVEPDDLMRLVRACRAVERAMGDGRKAPAACEADVARAARRSLVAVCTIPAGALIAAEDITCRRPGTGLAPALRDRLVGCRAVREIPAGALFAPDMFDASPAAEGCERRVA